MLLKSTEAWNFGIHDHIKLDFDSGFVVVTGKNKKGKSTAVIQATLYGLFGAAMLETPLSDTVKQGEKESSLKVVVKIGDYTIKRTKSSAMLTGPDGVKISGQVTVSDFVREELGLKPGSESRIMAAEQNAVTGVLSGKPGEVNKFIESVAGFSRIDEILSRVEEEFPFGSKKVYEEMIGEVERGLEKTLRVEIESPKPYEKDIQRFDSEIKARKDDIKVLRKNLGVVVEKLGEIADEEKKVSNLKNNIRWSKEKVAGLVTEIDSLSKQEVDIPVFVSEEVDKSRELITTWPTMVRKKEAYLWATELPEPESVWEGDLNSLLEEISVLERGKRSLELRASELQADIRAAKKQIVSGEDMVCRTCGTDLSGRYKKVNNALKEQIVEKTEEVRRIETKLDDFEDLQILLAIKKENEDRQRDLDRFRDVGFVIEKSVVPHKILYQDTPVTEILSEESYQNAVTLIKDYEAAADLKKNLNDRIAVKKKKLEDAESALAEFEKRLADRPEMPAYKDLEHESKELRKEIDKLLYVTETLTSERTEAEKSLQQIKSNLKEKESRVNEYKEKIKSLKRKIAKDERNRKLVANVRAAKVKVLNQVWSNILSFVSTQYSSIMGDQVEVIKTDTGFRVNGKPFKRLSGSERTVLGVSLRAALRAIFAERCECMLWDEPLDGADRETASAIIAAIKSIPGQNIMITHDNDSVDVCDQRIIIGGEK